MFHHIKYVNITYDHVCDDIYLYSIWYLDDFDDWL